MFLECFRGSICSIQPMLKRFFVSHNLVGCWHVLLHTSYGAVLQGITPIPKIHRIHLFVCNVDFFCTSRSVAFLSLVLVLFRVAVGCG